MARSGPPHRPGGDAPPVDRRAPDLGEIEGEPEAVVQARRSRARRAGRVAWPVLVSLVMASVMAVVVFPTRTYLAQRERLVAAEVRLDVLRERNREMAERVEQLHTAEEVERLAREQYNLVRPGEEAYAILPAPVDTAPGSGSGEAAPPPPVTARSKAASAGRERPAGWWDNVTGWVSDLF